MCNIGNILLPCWGYCIIQFSILGFLKYIKIYQTGNSIEIALWKRNLIIRYPIYIFSNLHYPGQKHSDHNVYQKLSRRTAICQFTCICRARDIPNCLYLQKIVLSQECNLHGTKYLRLNVNYLSHHSIHAVEFYSSSRNYYLQICRISKIYPVIVICKKSKSNFALQDI